MSIANELDDALTTLEKYSKNIVSNVKSLSDDISGLESKINTNTKASFDEIKSSLDMLKNKISSSVSGFEDATGIRDKEESRLLIEYYSNIILLKNEYMNNELKNADSLKDSFDNYAKEKEKFFLTVLGIITDEIKESSLLVDKSVSFIINSLKEYKTILLKYSDLFRISFDEIKSKLKSIDLIFTNEFENMYLKIKNIKDKYSLRIDYNEIHNAGNVNGSVESLSLEYNRKKDDLINEFRNKSESDIRRIELLLLNTFNETFNGSMSKEDIIGSVNNDNEGFLKESISGLNNRLSIDEFRKTVSDIYREKNENDYRYYLSLLKNLEKDYKSKAEALNYSKEITENTEELNNESKAFLNEYKDEVILESYYKEYKEYTKERIDILFEYKIKTLSLFKSINELYLTYEQEKGLIEASLNKEIRESVIRMMKEVDSIKNESSLKSEERNAYLNNILIADKKSKYLLDFMRDKLKLDKEYELKKSFMELSYELFKKEKDIATLDSRTRLKEIIGEYDAIMASYDAIYKSQELLLLRDKERNNLLDASKIDYAYSFLRHRLIIADEIIDVSEKEYSLRMNLLKEMKNNAKGYLEKLIEPILDQYMSDTKELKRIKDEKINPLLEKLEKRPDSTVLKDELEEVIKEYNSSLDSLNRMLLNDKRINYSKKEMRDIDEAVLSSIEDAKNIRKDSIKKALTELKDANEEFESIMATLDKSDIDFETSLNNYRKAYLEKKEKLDKKLDDDTAPILKDIEYTNKKYDLNDFKERLLNIDDDYNMRSLDLIEKYRKNIGTVEKETIIDYDKMLKESSLNLENSYKKRLISNEERFLKEKNISYNLYLRNMNNLNKKYSKRYNQFVKDVNGFKEMELSMIDDIHAMNESSKKKMKKTSYVINSNYIIDLKSIENDFKYSLKVIDKEVNKKYRNISVYDLSKK